MLSVAAVLQFQFLHTGGSTASVPCIGYRLRANDKDPSTHDHCELPEIACVVSFPHLIKTTGRVVILDALKVSTLMSATRIRTRAMGPMSATGL